MTNARNNDESPNTSDGSEIWQDVADGIISANEAYERRKGIESEVELAYNRALAEPPDPERRARATAMLLRQLGMDVTEVDATIVPLRRPRNRLFIGFGLAAPVAAAVLFWIPRDAPSTPDRISTPVAFHVGLRNGYSSTLAGQEPAPVPRKFYPRDTVKFEIFAGANHVDPEAVQGRWIQADRSLPLACTLRGELGTCELPVDVLGDGRLRICLRSGHCGESDEIQVVSEE